MALQQYMPRITQSDGPTAAARLGEHACLNFRRKRPHRIMRKGVELIQIGIPIHQQAPCLRRQDCAIVPDMWCKHALWTGKLLCDGRQAMQGEIRGECCVRDLPEKCPKSIHALEQPARPTCCLKFLFRHMMLDAGRTVRLQDQLSGNDCRYCLAKHL